MLRTPDRALPTELAKGLLGFQQSVDQASSYGERVSAAKDLWDRRNTASNPVFRELRKELYALCPGRKRCVWCEHSEADEIDHVYPKDLYPEEAFDWLNYVYACGPCNGPKGARAGVIPAGQAAVLEVTRARSAAVLPPAQGRRALINPRLEDPFDFLELDIVGRTFLFLPRLGATALIANRADFSTDILRLNTREHLIEARRNAYRGFRSLLRDYCEILTSSDDSQELKGIEKAIRNSPHRTVWRELVRQRTDIRGVADCFELAPAVLAW